MKNILKKIFNPNKIIGFILFNLGMGLLIYIFSFHLENTPLAYISYLLSAYALIIFCLWFYQSCRFSTQFIKNKSRLYKKYKKHHQIFQKSSLIISLSLNLIYGIFKLLLGIYYKSAWFITFAIYYLLLCFMRLPLVNNTNLKIEYHHLKHTGIILLLLNIILTGIIILIIKQNQEITYSGYLIYIVALYDFYLVISALINVFKYHQNNKPLLMARKSINLSVAMISLISLEVAMIYEFGSNDSSFKLIMISCTGFGICLINSFLAILMIINANKKLNQV